ncbi:MAG: hypothetical protein ACHQF0_00820 [Chitinophagales bacterium]
MSIKIKILYLIFLLWFFQSHQRAFAQEEVIEQLKNRFEQLNTQGLPEKLYVHTDKNFYTPGEIIWFKIYSVDGILNRPLDLSKAAYVEILGNDHKPVLQGKIPLKEGTGEGSFIISSSIGSGNYLLRAYTSWMKNGDPSFFFEKTITVVNSLKRPNWASIKKEQEKPDVQFLPEGGQLVNGIESRIAFKAVDKNGNGINCKGYITDQENNVAAYFISSHFGMGRFSFLPAEGKDYKAFIQLENGSSLAYPFPKANATGWVLKCEDENSQLLISVVTNNQLPGSYIYLLTQTRQVIKNIKAQKILSGKSEFTIDKNILGEGISDIIVFNDQLQPVCERLYFKRPGRQLQINLNTDREEYEKRRAVNLQMLATDQFEKPVIADLSVSVYLEDSIQSYSDDDIRSYLWLSSDLIGHVEKPAYYFTSNDTDAATTADILMMTQGWRRFDRTIIQQSKKWSPEFIPETEGSSVWGKIIDKNSGLPLAGVPAYFSVPGQNYFVTAAVSDTGGKLNFNTNSVYGNNEVVVQPGNTDETNNYRVDINGPFSNRYSQRSIPSFSMTENFISQLLTHTISSQVQNVYFETQQQQYLINSLFDSTAFFGKPDKKYFLDDYTRFRTMEEVMREYVPEVKLRKKEGEFHFMVKNLPYGSFFDRDPLILLDGIPVFKAGEIMSLDPLKIKKMEIVGRSFYTGPVVHTGIVSYSTYDGTLAGLTLSSNAIVTDYPGFLYERSFYSPVYQTQQELQGRLPDFRNVLDWEPELKTGIDGKHLIGFYTSDLPGKYIIVAEGISREGFCGSASAVITVKK